MAKFNWRKRTKGTSRQRGQKFKLNSGAVKGSNRSKKYKAKVTEDRILRKEGKLYYKLGFHDNEKVTLDGDEFTFDMGREGYATFNKADIQIIANPYWEGTENMPFEVMDDSGELLYTTEKKNANLRSWKGYVKLVEQMYKKFKNGKQNKSKHETFISGHPERYGYDQEKYSAIVVVEENGKVKEAHPAKDYQVAEKILKQLKSEA